MDDQQATAMCQRSFGEKLALIRSRRRYSQVRLSELADVSARHVSFLETGRASPSRNMVLRLATALALTPVETSIFMQSAGFAAEGPIGAGPIRHGSTSTPDLNILYAIEDATEIEDAISIAAAALEKLGLSQFFLGSMSLRGTSLVASIKHHNLSHAPLGWLCHYKEQNYGATDPLVVAAARLHLPFFWSEVLTPRLMADPTNSRMIGEASEFGITNGYVASIRHPDGQILAVSCMARFLCPNDPVARASARAITTSILHKADDHGLPERSVPLTLQTRPISILQHLLNGLGSDASAQRLGLSDTEFSSEATRLCRMFGTSDALHAALRARRYGLVRA